MGGAFTTPSDQGTCQTQQDPMADGTQKLIFELPNIQPRLRATDLKPCWCWPVMLVGDHLTERCAFQQPPLESSALPNFSTHPSAPGQVWPTAASENARQETGGDPGPLLGLGECRAGRGRALERGLPLCLYFYERPVSSLCKLQEGRGANVPSSWTLWIPSSREVLENMV